MLDRYFSFVVVRAAAVVCGWGSLDSFCPSFLFFLFPLAKHSSSFVAKPVNEKPSLSLSCNKTQALHCSLEGDAQNLKCISDTYTAPVQDGAQDFPKVDK